MTLSVPRRRRWLAALAASSLSLTSLLGVTTARAASRATTDTPFVSVKHVTVLKGSVKKAAAVSFVIKGLPASGVSAAVLSVSVTNPEATGALVGYGYGAKRPHVISLSFSKGHATSGLVVVVPGSKGRGTLFNASTASEDVAATLVGYYAAPGATNASTAFVPVQPRSLASVLLTKSKAGAFLLVGKGKLPSEAVGALVAVTTSSGASTMVTISPYGSKSAASLSVGSGRATTTLLVVKPGSRGRVRLTSKGKHAVRVRVDVVGYLKTLYVPGVPTGVTATADSKAALVAWKAPAADGGAPITSYTVTASPGGGTAIASGSATSVLVRDLTAGTAYTFTVTATNSRGAGPASPATTAVSPYTTPDAPGTAFGFTGGYGQVLVAVGGGPDDGGSPVTAYRVTASPGGAAVTIVPKAASTTSGTLTLGDLDTATFTGLTPGAFYTFTVVAINAAGDSAASPATVAVQAGGVGRASVSSNGAQGDSGSLDNDLSADGRYVVFDSAADNLVPGDAGGHQDVFLRDRLLGTTTLVSAASGGGAGDLDSLQPTISDDGRYVAFESDATNLTPVTIGGHFEVYVRDMTTGVTKLISAGPGGAANADSSGPAISGDGNTVVFSSAASNLATINTGLHQQVYAADRQSDDVVPVSIGVGDVQANGDSTEPTVSGDGTIVAWASKATNLVTGITLTHQQIYQRTLSSSTNSILSSQGAVIEGNGDADTPQISEDGSYTAFESLATNLTVMPDTNGADDVFLCFKGCSTPQAVDLSPFGTTANRGASLPSLSKDGSLVAYVSTSTDLVQGVVPLATAAQIFVSAWSSKKTQVASVASDGSLGNASSVLPRLTGDAAHVSFASFASNLAPGDTNSRLDVFVADLPSVGAGGLPSF